MLALLLILGSVLGQPVRAGPLEGETEARWRCEPEAVALGEPFALVLELEHAPDVAARALVPAALALDESWVVLASEPLTSAVLADGRLRTRATWRVAALEPGERSLAESLAGLALGAAVTRIQVGDARVRVAGVLAPGEDAPRPLRGFPEGFAGAPEASGGGGALPWLLGGLALLVLAAVGVLGWRRRRRRAPRPAPTPLERLRALEEARAGGGERCYELTRLLRTAGDELARTPRAALTDEEWLAAVHASLEIPRGVVAQLESVFARAARVKYAGESPTDWALQETFVAARGALEALQGGAHR
ncbi:MAG TPA: DUF4381 family protein [Planctomycetota bacterium]